MPKIVNPKAEQNTPEGKEAIARARAARAVLREQQQAKERAKEEQRVLRAAFYKNTARRTCVLYTVISILQFLAYTVIIFPTSEKPFSEMILGGISIKGHAVFFAAAFLCALVYSLVLYRRAAKQPHPVTAYLFRTCVWYTVVMAVCLSAHGIYMDMLYNQYDVTHAGIFLGPSYLLSFAALCFSLCMIGVNRIYKTALPSALRVLAHLGCTLVLISVCFQFIGRGFASASDLLIFLVIFSTAYALAAVAYFAAKGAVKREENEEQEYQSVYKKP